MVAEGLGIFCHINTIEFILYSTKLYNFSHIHSEAFSFIHGFFQQGFPHKSSVFLCFRISLTCH